MAKKVVSRNNKKKRKQPIKSRRNLKSVIKKFFNYMKSDTYMFAPLLSPSAADEPKGKGVVVQEDANYYLKSDCYMYAPLANDTCSIGACDDEILGVSEVNDNPAAVQRRRRRIVVHHTMLQTETIKQILHQNSPLPLPEKVQGSA